MWIPTYVDYLCLNANKQDNLLGFFIQMLLKVDFAQDTFNGDTASLLCWLPKQALARRVNK